jgi:putative flippase GtrA
MTDKHKQCWQQRLRYLWFGILTTLINYGSFWLLVRLWGTEGALAANAGAFVLATAFAYLTNKAFVFRATAWDGQTVLREVCAFTAGRLAAFAVEEAGLWGAIHLLRADTVVCLGISGVMLSKIALSGVAVILNYCFSLCFVFRRKEES